MKMLGCAFNQYIQFKCQYSEWIVLIFHCSHSTEYIYMCTVCISPRLVFVRNLVLVWLLLRMTLNRSFRYSHSDVFNHHNWNNNSGNKTMCSRVLCISCSVQEHKSNSLAAAAAAASGAFVVVVESIERRCERRGPFLLSLSFTLSLFIRT